VRNATNPQQTITTLHAIGPFRDADFSPDGSQLAVAETRDSIRFFSVPGWRE
jgi:hypothetical protein